MDTPELLTWETGLGCQAEEEPEGPRAVADASPQPGAGGESEAPVSQSVGQTQSPEWGEPVTDISRGPERAWSLCSLAWSVTLVSLHVLWVLKVLCSVSTFL